MSVKLGVIGPFVDGLITSPGFVQELAGTLEACGVESFWTVEHVVVAEDYEPRYPYSASGRMSEGAPRTPMPDPLETLAFVAAVTSTLRLGTAVVVAPLHSPAILAKRAATLDRLSGGRFMLGLGIGWQVEEYAAVGVPYHDRGRRLEECIGAMRALWADRPASYSGRYVSFDRVHSIPTPESGAVPVLLGGHSEPAVRRAGRLADGWFPFTIGPDDFDACMDVLREAATTAGRSPEAVEVSCWPQSAGVGSLDGVRRYVSAGASRVIVGAGITRPDELPRLRTDLLRFQDEVIAKL